MTKETFYNDSISVTASINHLGQVTPTKLIWQGKPHALTGVGRQWESEDGRHVLVEAASGDRFEILLSKQDLLWYVRRVWSQEIVA